MWGSSWKEENFSIRGREMGKGNVGENDPNLVYTFMELLNNEKTFQSFL